MGQAREKSDWTIAASELDQLAAFARDESRIDEALAMLAEALRITHDLKMPRQIVESLSRFAYTPAITGRAATAARLLGAAEALRSESGGSHSWVVDEHETTLKELRMQLDSSTLAKALEQGRRLTVDDAVALALASVDTPGSPLR
jgi:hypothetical protein